jgi:hypothetical protein
MRAPSYAMGLLCFVQDCGRDWNAAACEQAVTLAYKEARLALNERPICISIHGATLARGISARTSERARTFTGRLSRWRHALAVCFSVCARNERRSSSFQGLQSHHSIALGPLSWRAAASALAALSFALSLGESVAIALGPVDLRASASALAARSRAAFSSFTR